MPTKRHTDRDYEAELTHLRERLLLMAGRVEVMIADAVRAMVDRDADLAADVIKEDHRVNRDEVETDEFCLKVLARRQPMASDLRFITLALKMVTDLERIADLAVNICERAIDLSAEPPLKPYDGIIRMASLTQSMVRDAIDAFISGEVDAAREVLVRDDEVDELYRLVFRDLLAIMVKEPSAIERGIHVQSVAKYLERMADHSTNLAEQVIFMVKGKDIRHIGKGRPPA